MTAVACSVIAAITASMDSFSLTIVDSRASICPRKVAQLGIPSGKASSYLSSPAVPSGKEEFTWEILKQI